MSKHKVLVPLDGSDFSQQILAQVRRFFNPADNQMFLLRVSPIPPGINTRPVEEPAAIEWPLLMYSSHQDAEMAKHPIYSSQVMDSLAITFEDELETERVSLENEGYTVTVVIKFGDPAQEILNVVEEKAIDLIAMTTHGRTGLSRLIFGSVAEKVLHKTPVPVILLRPSHIEA